MHAIRKQNLQASIGEGPKRNHQTFQKIMLSKYSEKLFSSRNAIEPDKSHITFEDSLLGQSAIFESVMCLHGTD
jgi:hypothetical protein